MTTTPTTDGIFLEDKFLAEDDLSLEAKIIYLLIKRELDKTNKYFTQAMTDPRLSNMTGFSMSTVQRKIHELDKKGYIALVSVNRAVARNKRGLPRAISGIRYIYLDRKLAGYRRRAINKKKRPVEGLYQLLVLEGQMSPQQYVEMMKKERQRLHEDEEDRERKQYQETLVEIHCKLPDDQLAELEKLDDVPPGTYVKQKNAHLERLKDDDDGYELFDTGDHTPGV